MSGCSERFDQIIQDIGAFGKYQKKQFLFVIIPYILFYAFLVNYVFVLATPDHWCNVPGREFTNITKEQWKKQNIPLVLGPDGTESFSKCEKYANPDLNTETTECTNGWEYSTEIYAETAVTYYDWVCDRKTTVTLTFVLTYLGQAFSAVVFGPAMDYIGRRAVFLLTVVVWVVFGTAALFATNPIIFIVLWFLKNLMHPACLLALIVLYTEMVLPEHRSNLQLLTQLTWPIAMSIMTFVAWVFQGHFVHTGLATTLPLAYFLFLYKYIPESPRWLAAKGRVDEAEKIITQIAEENNKPVPKDLRYMLQVNEKVKTKIGILTLFLYSKQRWRMLAIMLTNAAAVVVYYGVIINTGSTSGNIYLDFFLLSFFEIPGYLFGTWLMNTIGRRFSTVAFLVMSAISCIVAAFIPSHIGWAVLVFSIIAKFATAGLFLTVSMHQLEIFPTAYRSTALTPAVILARTSNIIVPLLVELRDINPILPFLCMAVFPIIAAPVHLLVPETVGKSLPQTIEESEDFGTDQSFWSLNVR